MIYKWYDYIGLPLVGAIAISAAAGIGYSVYSSIRGEPEKPAKHHLEHVDWSRTRYAQEAASLFHEQNSPYYRQAPESQPLELKLSQHLSIPPHPMSLCMLEKTLAQCVMREMIWGSNSKYPL